MSGGSHPQRKPGLARSWNRCHSDPMAQNTWANWPFWGVSTRDQALSGDVSQWLRIFSPTVTVNGSGNPDLEGEIVRNVATYGSQLGQISAIVLALAKDNKSAPAGRARRWRTYVSTTRPALPRC